MAGVFLKIILGEDKTTNEKYWIIQNTWGPNWGENGFFRMRRGTDEFGIESICEVAYPLIWDNKNSKYLQPGEAPLTGNIVIQDKDNILLETNDTNSSIFDIFK